MIHSSSPSVINFIAGGASLRWFSTRLSGLVGELSEPLVNHIDNLCCVPVIKMVAAIDLSIDRTVPRGFYDFLRIFMKERRFGAADDGEQRAADVFRIGPAVVAIVFAVFIQVAAGAEDARRGSDGDRHQFFTPAFGDHLFRLLY